MKQNKKSNRKRTWPERKWQKKNRPDHNNASADHCHSTFCMVSVVFPPVMMLALLPPHSPQGPFTLKKFQVIQLLDRRHVASADASGLRLCGFVFVLWSGRQQGSPGCPQDYNKGKDRQRQRSHPSLSKGKTERAICEPGEECRSWGEDSYYYNDANHQKYFWDFLN